MLRPQLTKLDAWLAEWEVDEEDQRKLYCQIADIAEESGEEKRSYQYVLKALRTFDPKETEEISSTEAQNISPLKHTLRFPRPYISPHNSSTLRFPPNILRAARNFRREGTRGLQRLQGRT